MRDSKRDTDVQNGLLDSEGEGEGGMIWENGTETCILLSCKKRIVRYRIQDAWGWCTGMIQRDDMGWEVGGGRWFQDCELMYTHGGFMSMYGKTNTVL